MLTPTPAGAAWPARLAFCAAVIFTLASTGTNLIYGISKGADTASSAVWAAVSVAVSIVFALSWPAFLQCLDRREWARAMMVLAALIVTGSYSVTAALGSVMGGRANAAIEEKDLADKRAKAQTAYDNAKAEMEAILATRSVAELDALISNVRYANGCDGLGGRMTNACRNTKLAGWKAERERAIHRTELREEMARAQARFDKTPVVKIANSDVVALASYFQALGLNMDAERANKLLVLLAVFVIECGGGLALAVGMSLSEHREQRVRERLFANDRTSRSPAFGANTVNTSKNAPRTRPERSPNAMVFAPVQDCSRKTVGERLIGVLRERGAPLQTSIRTLALHLGTSPTTLHTVAGELITAGVLGVVANRQGSVFRLLAA
jgi:hypothetical protein